MRLDGIDDQTPQWFCLRSQAGRQNVAAAYLRSFGVQTFNPQIRHRRATRTGVQMRSEPLFPNYLFARFALAGNFRRVRYGFGVSDVLRFGEHWCILPDREIEDLQQRWGPGEALEIPPCFEPGQRVRLSGSLFHGIEAVVLCHLPGRERVKVLLEFFGGQTTTEVRSMEIAPVLCHPLVA
jgi:transcriptional antiterminator RfaH